MQETVYGTDVQCAQVAHDLPYPVAGSVLVKAALCRGRTKRNALERADNALTHFCSCRIGKGGSQDIPPGALPSPVS